jgi:hypothetical protein
MTHVHTTCGKLNTSFNWTTRHFTREWAATYAEIEQATLKQLALGPEEGVTVQQFWELRAHE